MMDFLSKNGLTSISAINIKNFVENSSSFELIEYLGLDEEDDRIDHIKKLFNQIKVKKYS
jgi:hypothetical protein